MTSRAMGWAFVAATTLLLAGCQLLGDVGPPTIFVQEPDNFSILAESPTDINGIVYGQVDQIDIAVDGQSAGRPQEGDSASTWVLPVTRGLGEGLHRVRAVASGPSGTAADSAIFAIGTLPFTIGFVPERLVVDRSVPRDEPVPALLGVLGPPAGEGYEVSLALEDAGGLTFDIFPFDALESTGGFFQGETEAIETGQWVFVDLAVDAQTPVGEHRLTVRADGPDDTDPQRATLTVEVTDGATSPTQQAVAPGAPHVEAYRVRSRVTESDVPDSAGDRANATWRLAFGCADGRCDVEVRNGGPRSELPPFTAQYDPATEAYAFEWSVQTPGESCPELRTTGQIEPVTWDARGPVRFRYRMEGVNHCARADIRTVWEGTGRRR